MSDLEDKIVQAHKILVDAMILYEPREVFGLFSGGYDSLVVADLLNRYFGKVYIGHLNTGIGIKETHDYVAETCRDRNWNLVEYHTPESYDELVMEWGFPGPAHHWKMYCRLKDRSVDKLVRENKQGWLDRIMLVTGIRRQESKKRMGYWLPVQRRGAQVWVNPILHWSKFDVHAYKARYELPNNLVVDTLHGSKECCCGAYAHKGEKREIEIFYPEMGKRLNDLEVKVRAAGFNWGWEDAPPVRPDPRQGNLFMPLCVGCEQRI